MTEEKDFIERKIKNFSSTEIQNTIASALSKLFGEKYEAEIKAINYNHSKASLLTDSTEINMVISKKSEWL